jgi:hypothetical protein
MGVTQTAGATLDIRHPTPTRPITTDTLRIVEALASPFIFHRDMTAINTLNRDMFIIRVTARTIINMIAQAARNHLSGLLLLFRQSH